ncbi:hypothetical protein SRHO_G00028670 [Serrasalmus rhombeus]
MSAATLPSPAEKRPRAVVSIEPDDQVFSGETVTLRCDIQGGGVSNWQYSWYKDGSSTPVSNEQQYSISSVTESHRGTYTCRGTERGTSRYSHTSDAVTLTVSDGLCFCNNVAGLFEAICITCNPNDWRLFIDSSCKSLKAVLLHNGNKYPSLPVAHSVHLKEEYTSVKMLLGALKYDEYGWEVIGDFKMVSFLMGLQGGFTKYPCFICLWDSRDTKAHYHRRDWPQRTEFTVGKNNVKWEPLVDPRKVLMPPLHIKLGLIKQFVRALDKESRAFSYLQDFFPKLSEAKIKAGVFVGPQIKKIIECSEFPKKLNRKERAAWNSFVAVVRGFLGNHKYENYVQLVQTLIKNYAAMGCRMSLKIHILDAHLDKFKENMGAYSEEQGERSTRTL